MDGKYLIFVIGFFLTLWLIFKVRKEMAELKANSKKKK